LPSPSGIASSASSPISEGIRLGPHRYFDGMVVIVNRDEGTMNKYNSDNVPVLWSASLVSFGLAMGYH
jgi:hypothetical protein